MVQVELSRIIIDEEKQEQVIVLKEIEGARILPIVVGMNEAAAIRMHLGGVRPPRPLTHDLLCSLLNSLRVQLEKVVIDKLINNTFHAKLHLVTKGSKPKVVDARPSDSVALAVRTKCPIFVEEQVFGRLSQEV